MTNRNLFQINHNLLLLIFNYLAENNISSYISIAYISRASKRLIYSIMKHQAENNYGFKNWITEIGSSTMQEPHHQTVQQQMKEYFLFFNFKTNYKNYDSLTVAKSAIQNHSMVDIRALGEVGFDFLMEIEKNITLMQSVLCFDICDRAVFKQRCEILSEILKMGYFPKEGAIKFLKWFKKYYELKKPKAPNLPEPYIPPMYFWSSKIYLKNYNETVNENKAIMTLYNVSSNKFNLSYEELYSYVKNLLNAFKNEYKNTCTLFKEFKTIKPVKYSHDTSIELTSYGKLI